MLTVYPGISAYSRAASAALQPRRSKDDDPDQLAKVLEHAILHPEQLAAMKADCRKMYEKYYSNEAYVATLTRLVNESTD